MEEQKLGLQSSVRLASKPILCTSGNIVTTKHYLNSTGAWGNLQYNTGVPVYQRDQISATISCQVCSKSAEVMEDLLTTQEEMVEVEINSASNGFYWNSFGASVNQGSFVSGNFSFIRNGEKVTYGSPSNGSPSTPIPYYNSSCDGDCIGWNFSVSQTVTFKIMCTKQVYVVFGISNANITITDVEARGEKESIAVNIGGSKLQFNKCKLNSITPNVIGTNNFILYDTNYISYKMRTE